MRTVLLEVLSVVTVVARHDLMFEPWLRDPNDPTVNSATTVPMIAPMDNKNLWVTQRSPTTQLVSFSPDRLAISKAAMLNSVNPYGAYNRSIHTLALQQRMCKVARGGSIGACYQAPFTVSGLPPENEQNHFFYRQAGMASFTMQDLQVVAAQYDFADTTAITSMYGWGGDPLTATKCDNHRAVEAANAYPELLAQYPNLDFSMLFHNDAEHAESTLGVPPGSCRWKHEMPEFVQAVAPLAGQLHPDTLGVSSAGTWDHNIEVCAHEVGCSPNDFFCLNVYSLALVTNDPAESGGPANVYLRQSEQFPQYGAGDVLGVRAIPTSGPFAPCPVGVDGRQTPCSPLVDGMRPPGFVAPEAIVFTVEDIRLGLLKRVGADSFTLKLSYYMTWSDRFAVHPCRVSLYSSGGGVPEGGKLVDANAWWKPDPDKDSSSSLSFTHSPNLTVLHRPGEPVTRACDTLTCPWPKQLFFREKIKVELTESATWDLFKFPFDKQILKARVQLLDADTFASETTFLAARVNATLPSMAAFSNHMFGELYKKNDWSVYYGAVEQDPDDERVLIFVLKIARNAASTIFKVFIPAFANALVVVLTSTMNNEQRLKVLVLSLLASATMLNPSFLGLPEGVQGVPFIQSIIIIHFCVAGLLLAYTMGVFVTDMLYDKTVEDEKKKYTKTTKAVWKQHAAVYNKWADLMLPPPPVPPVAVGAPGAPVRQNQIHVALAQPDPADEKKKGNDDDASKEAEGGVDLQRATAEILLSLPALFHRQDPTRPPTIWTPFGVPQPQILPKYGRILQFRQDFERHFIWVLPALYILLWSLVLVIYFGVTPSEPA